MNLLVDGNYQIDLYQEIPVVVDFFGQKVATGKLVEVANPLKGITFSLQGDDFRFENGATGKISDYVEMTFFFRGKMKDSKLVVIFKLCGTPDNPNWD